MYKRTLELIYCRYIRVVRLNNMVGYDLALRFSSFEAFYALTRYAGATQI